VEGGASLAAERLKRSAWDGKTIDGHSHAGVSLKAYALGEYPYAQTVEGLRSQQCACGVDATIVFPFTADLFFDPARLLEGTLIPAEKPLSQVPYGAENRMLLRELYDYCPELIRHFMPFVHLDPERCVEEQVRLVSELADRYPVYGVKINPVGCQSHAAGLLGRGAALLDLCESRDWPLLFHVTTLPGEDYSQARDVFTIIERRPKLRFCMAHSLLFHRASLERANKLPNVWVDTAALKIQVESMRAIIGKTLPASDFIDADYSDHRRVLQVLGEHYPDTIIWGTDSPAYSWICRRKEGEGIYRDFRLKGSYEDEVAALDALPPLVRARVGGGNALDFVFGRNKNR